MSTFFPEPITPEQCRAARALLEWSQSDLETASGVARKTIADFEGNKKERPYDRTLRDLRAALEEAGVIFVPQNGNGPGVRLQRWIWRLAPINSDSFNWAASSYAGEVIVRASTEYRARQIATAVFWQAVERKSLGQPTAINPWSRLAGETTCEKVATSPYPVEGREEVLSPPEYDRIWLDFLDAMASEKNPQGLINE